MFLSREYAPSADSDFPSSIDGEFSIACCLNEHNLHGEPKSEYFHHQSSRDFALLSASSSDPCETSPSKLRLVQNSQLGWTLRSVRQTVSNPF